MGKHNNNKGKQQKPNWFAQQRQRYGSDFMSVLNAKIMEQGAATIFRDMSRGNFDINIDGPCFLNGQFILACMQLATTKMQLHGTHMIGNQARAMMHQYFMRHGVDSNNMDLMAIYNAIRFQDERAVQSANVVNTFDTKCYEAWNLIYNTMNQLQVTGDPNVLVPLIGALNRNYRYNIV